MSNLAKLKKTAAEFEQKRQFERALTAYEEVLRAQDGSEELDVSLYNRVGDLHLRQGRAAEALRSYERAADLYIERGFHNNAIALCNKILRQDPTRAEVHYKLGRVSATKGFRTDARQHFLEYAALMQQAGKLDDAFAALQEFADLAPEHDDLRLLLADQLARHGRVEQAVVQLRLVLELYESERRHAEAQQVRERIHALDPDFLEQPDDLAGPSRDSGEVPVPRRPSTPAGGARAAGMPELVLIEPTSFSERRSAPTPIVPGPAVPPGATSSALEGDDVGPLARPSGPVEMPEGLIRGADVDFDHAAPAIDGLDHAREGDFAGPHDEVDSMAGFMPTIESGDAGAVARTSDDAAEGEDDDVIVVLPFITEAPDGAESGNAAAMEGTALDAGDGFDLMLPDDAGGAWSPDDIAVDAAAPAAPRGPRTGDVAEDGARSSEPSRSARLAAARTSLVLGDVEAAVRTVDALIADYDAAGEQAAAEAALDELLEAAPATVPLIERRAARAQARGEVERARALYAHILELEPRNAAAEAALGIQRAPLRPVRPAVPTPIANRSVLATPLATRPVPSTPVGTRPVQDPAAGTARTSGWVNLGDLLRDDEGPRSTRLVVEERAPTGDEQADFSTMLRKFKQGVAENVDDEDYASHYDLGVAYKEMGLVDDAIAQFQRALRGTHLRARAYEALGQCFVDRGQYAVATAVLERATAEAGLDDQQLVGVLYLLGRAAEAMNNRSEALRYYQRVLAVDITFSDVAERMGMVEQVPR